MSCKNCFCGREVKGPCISKEIKLKEDKSIKVRRCRKCDKKLPKTRYFNCYECVEHMNDVDNTYTYDEDPYSEEVLCE